MAHSHRDWRIKLLLLVIDESDWLANVNNDRMCQVEKVKVNHTHFI